MFPKCSAYSSKLPFGCRRASGHFRCRDTLEHTGANYRRYKDGYEKDDDKRNENFTQCGMVVDEDLDPGGHHSTQASLCVRNGLYERIEVEIRIMR